MPDHLHTREALREERRPDRPTELALTPRMRLDGQVLYVSATSARTRRRSHDARPARPSVRV